LAALLRQQGNEDIILGRYSTAELIAILPMTAPDAAQSLADKVQADFQAASGDAAPRRLTVGLAHFPDQADSAEQLLERAEIMLYQARTATPPDIG
ncbi:MAG: diguanylate cyclase, partial [Anaerolineae bacterium]|nr:diguanylate cyclase [Anaerolineae bacterium]